MKPRIVIPRTSHNFTLAHSNSQHSPLTHFQFSTLVHTTSPPHLKPVPYHPQIATDSISNSANLLLKTLRRPISPASTSLTTPSKRGVSSSIGTHRDMPNSQDFFHNPSKFYVSDHICLEWHPFWVVPIPPKKNVIQGVQMPSTKSHNPEIRFFASIHFKMNEPPQYFLL